jgi:hypothetical protein
VLFIWIATRCALDGTAALASTVASLLLTAHRRAEKLHPHRAIIIAAEGILHGFEIRRVPITGQISASDVSADFGL